ncbi:hypothetical protein PRNP1_000127 [Phytophthora ramorum]
MGNDVDASQVKMGFASKVGGCCKLGNKSWLLSLLGFVFVILNLAALWALHFADRPVTKGSLRSTTRFTTTNLGITDGATPNVGDAVSFDSDNALHTGAGTTAYLDKLNLGADLKSVSYINFAPIGTSAAYFTTNVMSYLRTTADGVTESILTTFSYDASTKTLTTADTDRTNNVVTDKIRGLATLSDTAMVVLTVWASADGASIKTSVMPAVLDGKTVKLVQGNIKQVTAGSVTNFIAPLSSSAFVVAYYDTWSSAYWQNLVVGSVGTDGTITLGFAKNFGVKNADGLNTQFGAPLALKGAGIAIPYYTTLNTYAPSTPAKTDADLKGLCVAYSAFNSNTITGFTDVCATTYYRPSHYPEPIALSDNAMAVVFHDKANSNALTLVTLKMVGSALTFQTSYVFKEVFGSFDYGKGYEFNMEPRLRLLSGNRLAVSFLNPALAGRLSVRIVGYSALTLTFNELTPVLPVALPGVSLALTDTANSAGSITQDLVPVGADGFVASYVGYRDNIVHQRFIVLETLTKPVGVIQSVSSDGTAIATQGRVEVDGLASGEFHYATTSGALVAKGDSLDSSSAEYIYAANNSVLVTTTSRVGVAIDDDTLFVSATF